MANDERIHVLQVVPSLSQANGVAACICNYFQYLDKDKFDVTFAVLTNTGKDRYESVIKNGGNIVELFRIRNIFAYIKKIKRFYHEKKFDIVHCNVANTGLIFLYYAWKSNVKVRILHSHATQSSDKFLNRLRNDIILFFTKKFANRYVACSEAAGIAMFGEKDFFVLHNGIEYEKYKFRKSVRDKIRRELSIGEKQIVLGNIGRLCNQKNQKFLIALTAQLKDKLDLKTIIIGNGPLEDELKKMVTFYNIEDNVIFMGSIKNTNELYNSFDVFLLPSLYEGLPVVGVEAQANGLPCIFSDTITHELKINNNIKFVHLDMNEWIEEITRLSIRNDKIQNFFESSNYNIKNEAQKMENLYIKLSGDINDI